MKTKWLLAAVGLWSSIACGAADGVKGTNRGNMAARSANSVAQVDVNGTITNEEKEHLIFMWQEEKLARDVYLNLFDLWSHRVIDNISHAEQTHMAMVEGLLVAYKLGIPGDSNIRGQFVDAGLQKLYDDLNSKGKLSLKDALEVGQMIELKDIADLEAALPDASADIAGVYQRLLDASYRHLAAFKRQLGN